MEIGNKNVGALFSRLNCNTISTTFLTRKPYKPKLNVVVNSNSTWKERVKMKFY